MQENSFWFAGQINDRFRNLKSFSVPEYLPTNVCFVCIGSTVVLVMNSAVSCYFHVTFNKNEMVRCLIQESTATEL